MKNEKGEEPDKLFKKGLEDPVNEPVFREADWDAMEQMLDKHKKRGGIIYWLPRMSSAAALILLALGWWLLKPRVVKNNINQQASAVHHATKPNTGTGGGATGQKKADSTSRKIPAAAGYAANPVHHGRGKHNTLPYSPVGPAAALPGRQPGSQALASAGKNNPARNKKGLNPAGDNQGQVIANNAGNPAAANRDKKEVATADANKLSPASGNSLAAASPDKKEVATADANKLSPANGNSLAAASPDKKELATADDKKLSPANGNSLAATSPDKKELATADDKKEVATADDKKNTGTAMAANTPAAKVKVTGKPSPGGRAVFAITTLASSDLNGVSSFQGGRVGGNFGVLLGITVHKWTFSTGGMYSIKPYQVGFGDYHTGYNFNTNPSSVGANCRMIDIPFDVNYQLYNKGGNKFTVGTGLSSYIILREDYTFNYTSPYADGPGGFSVVNKNRNIFSILNLDATYEHRINSRFGIEFQPYIKLPFSNVGASQVRLQTAGVAVGLNWNLNSFKKPD